MEQHGPNHTPDPELPLLTGEQAAHLREDAGGGESAQELLHGVHARLLPHNALTPEAGAALGYARLIADDLVFAYALDRPRSVRMLTDQDVERVGDPQALADAARSNLMDVPVEHEEIPLEGGAVLQSVYGDSPFVASKALYLSQLHHRLTGASLPQAGALVVVPTRHLLAYHPLADATVAEAINSLAAYALGAYEDGPGSLSPRVYWWHEGRLTCLTRFDEQSRTFSLQPPPELMARLRTLVRLDEAGRITRSTAPAAADVPRLLSAAGEALDRLPQETTGLHAAFTQLVELAHAHCAQDPRASTVETWDAWATAVQLGSALFTGSEPQTCALGENLERPLPAFPAQPPADARAWLDAFYLAVICRQQSRIQRLARVPMEVLRQDGCADAYLLHWIDALQTYVRPDSSMDEVVGKLSAAMQTSYGDALSHAPVEFVDAVEYQPVALLHRLLARDPEAFAKTLDEALTGHAAYWGASTAPRARVALGPLAMASLAHDFGFPLAPEQQYLPEYLRNGERVEVIPE
ncbi:immunity 49 family protein [Streptomyces sp. NPDC058657]|uniref:immunity 49 family protein n=1 Tax=unclassified Streptomyces TaxID=2593676 RepID=UPI003659EA2D